MAFPMPARPARAAPAFLDTPGWETVLAAARGKVVQLGGVGGTVAIEELSADEAEALRGLPARVGPGTPRAGRPFTLDLRRLDAALRITGAGIGLAEALELVGPPLDSRPARRERERSEREAFWRAALAHPLCEREPAVRGWVQELRARGSLRWIEEAGNLLEALAVGLRLPARPAIERSRLAAEGQGDPHALDDDRPIARLLVRQLAAREGTEPPATALARRDLLARFGVLCDSLSCDVLALGLRPRGNGPLALALAALEGHHMRITLAQLQTEPAMGVSAETPIFCCENPVVLAAAEQRLWPDVPPLICTAGWPNAAACTLLDRLRASGAQIRYHGDFDWEGLRIYAWLREQVGVEPWRMDASGYRAALAAAGAGGPTSPLAPLAAAPVGVDPALVAAMREGGRVVSEELLVDALLEDLACATGRRSRPTAAWRGAVRGTLGACLRSPRRR